MNTYCVTSLQDPDFYFLVDADRFEIVESGYAYFWEGENIIVSLRWDKIRSIERYCEVDNGMVWINNVWTNQDGFVVEM